MIFILGIRDSKSVYEEACKIVKDFLNNNEVRFYN